MFLNLEIKVERMNELAMFLGNNMSRRLLLPDLSSLWGERPTEGDGTLFVPEFV
jgi:hypothetical protein